MDITVNNGAGTSAVSSADEYSYDPTPTVSGLSPSAARAGGNAVDISGAGFTSGAAVKFGTTPRHR